MEEIIASPSWSTTRRGKHLNGFIIDSKETHIRCDFDIPMKYMTFFYLGWDIRGIWKK